MEPKVMIDSLDTARLACPRCDYEETLQLSTYSIRLPETRVKCRCKCGHTYKAILSKKSRTLKDKQLLGTYISQDHPRMTGKMVIKKLNNKGITLKTNIEQQMMPGLKLELEFVLDDAKQSIVRKDVVITAKKGRYLSAEFISKEHNDNLGPYLLHNKL